MAMEALEPHKALIIYLHMREKISEDEIAQQIEENGIKASVADIHACLNHWCPLPASINSPNPSLAVTTNTIDGRSPRSVATQSSRLHGENCKHGRDAHISRASLENISEGVSPIERYQQEHQPHETFSLGFEISRPHQVETWGQDIAKEECKAYSRRREDSAGTRPDDDIRGIGEEDEYRFRSVHYASTDVDIEDIVLDHVYAQAHGRTSPLISPVDSSPQLHQNRGTYGIDHALPEAPTPEERSLASPLDLTFAAPITQDPHYVLSQTVPTPDPAEDVDDRQYEDETGLRLQVRRSHGLATVPGSSHRSSQLHESERNAHRITKTGKKRKEKRQK